MSVFSKIKQTPATLRLSLKPEREQTLHGPSSPTPRAELRGGFGSACGQWLVGMFRVRTLEATVWRLAVLGASVGGSPHQCWEQRGPRLQMDAFWCVCVCTPS